MHRRAHEARRRADHVAYPAGALEVICFNETDSSWAFALRREVDERVRQGNRAVAVGHHAERLLNVSVGAVPHAVDRADEREEERRAREQRSDLVADRGVAAPREHLVD